jgi:hypothetical protein
MNRGSTSLGHLQRGQTDNSSALDPIRGPNLIHLWVDLDTAARPNGHSAPPSDPHVSHNFIHHSLSPSLSPDEMHSPRQIPRTRRRYELRRPLPKLRPTPPKLQPTPPKLRPTPALNLQPTPPLISGRRRQAPFPSRTTLFPSHTAPSHIRADCHCAVCKESFKLIVEAWEMPCTPSAATRWPAAQLLPRCRHEMPVDAAAPSLSPASPAPRQN